MEIGKITERSGEGKMLKRQGKRKQKAGKSRQKEEQVEEERIMEEEMDLPEEEEEETAAVVEDKLGKKKRKRKELNWKKVPVATDVFFNSKDAGMISLEEIDPAEFFANAIVANPDKKSKESNKGKPKKNITKEKAEVTEEKSDTAPIKKAQQASLPKKAKGR